MRNNRLITAGLLLGSLFFLCPPVMADWEWESGAKAGYSSNLDRAVTNPQGSPFLSAFLSLNREAGGNSRLDWFLLAMAEGTVYFSLSDLNALTLTLAPGLTYNLNRTWSLSLAPFFQAKEIVDSDQSALALGGKIQLKQKWGDDFYTGQYYLYKDSRANVDTYSFTENALGLFLGIKLSAKAFGEIGLEFSRSDSFRAVEQQAGSGSAQGRGNGRNRRFSQAFGSEVIRENVDRQALGFMIGYDWTRSIFSMAGYTFTSLQGDSGNSSDHSIFVTTGYRF
jgi:hypothetical protein